jgi:hypothetical protein
LPKLNAGWVENAEPDGLELNMVVSAAASAGAELENACWCCCARRLHHGRSQKSIATMTPGSAPRDHIAVLPTICIVAATHLDRCYNIGLECSRLGTPSLLQVTCSTNPPATRSTGSIRLRVPRSQKIGPQ